MHAKRRGSSDSSLAGANTDQSDRANKYWSGKRTDRWFARGQVAWSNIIRLAMTKWPIEHLQIGCYRRSEAYQKRPIRRGALSMADYPPKALQDPL